MIHKIDFLFYIIGKDSDNDGQFKDGKRYFKWLVTS